MTNSNKNTNLGYSPDVLAQRKAELLAFLSQTAPEVFNDNQHIDINKLKELLGEDQIIGNEHYELSWAGKAAARREIQKTSSHTLLPSAANPPYAQHILIEGENLEVLRVLQKSYYGKVKMIYIDPPYNTGNDSFVYPDDYSETLEEYQKRTGEKNEAGYLNKQSLWKKNSKESGQYHSAWLSMMYPRLYLARNLLRDDGVVFISIDGNEAANLKLLCNEIFGDGFVELYIWNLSDFEESSFTKTASHTVRFEHEYIVACYKKDKKLGRYKEYRLKDRTDLSNADNDPRGEWFSGNLSRNAITSTTGSKYFTITTPSGMEYSRNWTITEDEYRELVADNRIYFGKDGEGVPRLKMFKNDPSMSIQSSIFTGVKTSISGKNVIKSLFDNKEIFDFPKPLELIKRLLAITCQGNDIVLDFFAGSGTTAHAVMELNVEDGGGRQCICVQMPEVLEENSEAYKAGYYTIADITRARIDKAIAKLKTEHPDKTADLACAHFTLAPSNFKVWRGDVTEIQAIRDQLALFQSTEKTGQVAQPVDAQIAMLTELLLKYGLGALGVHSISKPLQVAGVTVHRVLANDDRTLWLCFENYTEALKDEIVRARPMHVLILNSCFVGERADELLSNLQLELDGLDIGLTII